MMAFGSARGTSIAAALACSAIFAGASPAGAANDFTFRQSVASGLESGDWRLAAVGYAGDAASDVFITQPTGNRRLGFGVNTNGDLAFTYGPAGPFIDSTARLYIGDFGGDGWDDMFVYREGDGSVSVYLRNANGPDFAFAGFLDILTPASGWRLILGDFDGGGSDSPIAYHPALGQLLFAAFLEGGPVWIPVATVSSGATWLFAAGRFTAGDYETLAGYDPVTNALWIAEPDFFSLQFHLAGNAGALVSQLDQLLPGDFNRDGRGDVLGYEAATGTLIVGLGNGTGFTLQDWGALPAPGNWRLVTGEFVGTKQTDVLAYDVTSNAFWVGDNQSRQCSNGFDDDGDGLVDHPADNLCSSPSDGDEKSSCGLGGELVLGWALLARRRRRAGAPR